MVVQQSATYIYGYGQSTWNSISSVQLQWLGSLLRPQIITISSISKRALFL